jgi:hypothetical protein
LTPQAALLPRFSGAFLCEIGKNETQAGTWRKLIEFNCLRLYWVCVFNVAQLAQESRFCIIPGAKSGFFLTAFANECNSYFVTLLRLTTFACSPLRSIDPYLPLRHPGGGGVVFFLFFGLQPEGFQVVLSSEIPSRTSRVLLGTPPESTE